jgi:hypothetical protein
MLVSEIEAQRLIEKIAAKVKPEAAGSRLKRTIQLVLGSFSADHVLTELLQNADDVGATFAEIEIGAQGMFLIHNGIDFDESHVEALCDIGQTTKKAGTHIGFMGIGFKASFKVSDTPHIVSGPYRFYFSRDDVIVPYWLKEIPSGIKERYRQGVTVIYLPFRQDLNQEILHSIEETAIARLEPLSLVFLRNIERLRVASADTTRELRKAKRMLSEVPSLRKTRVTIEEIRNGQKSLHDYLEFTKTLLIPEVAKRDYRIRDSPRQDLITTDLATCFRLRDGIVEPIPVEESVLYTFLPTMFHTGLRFALNCDFLLNTQRSEPDFTSQWNLWLLASLNHLLNDIIADLLQDRTQRVASYDVLPRKAEISETFAGMRTALLDYLGGIPCIVTPDGSFARISDVVMASRDVQEIIPAWKANATKYVNHGIRGRVFLRDELGVRDLTSLTSEISLVISALQDKKWLATIDGNHIASLYEFLHKKMYGPKDQSWGLQYQEHVQYEGKLKEIEFVRCVDRTYHKPGEVILPVSSEGQSVDPVDLPLTFVDSEKLTPSGLELLKNLGVAEFSEESVLSRLFGTDAAGKWKSWNEKQRIRSLEYAVKILKSNNYQIKESFRSWINGLVIPVEGNNWAVAPSCYIADPQLKFAVPNASYVDSSLFGSMHIDTEMLLRVIGVVNYPRIVVSDGDKRRRDVPTGVPAEKWEAYWRWLSNDGQVRQGTQPSNNSIISGFLDGFEECVTSGDQVKLEVYMKFLMEHWEEYYSRYTRLSYYYSFYGWNHEDVPSYFAYQLRTSTWLISDHGLRRPAEVYAPLREIKRVAASLVPYVKLAEDQAKRQKIFLDFLSVTTDVNLPMLLNILTRIREVQLNESTFKQLGRIYQKLAGLCEDQELTEEVWVPGRNGTFVPSKTLYWMDDPEIESLTGDELPLAWIPENMSRPQITALFRAFGIRNVSSMVERSRIADGQRSTEDDAWTRALRDRADFVYSALLHFEAGKVGNFPNFIRTAVVMNVEQARVQIKVLTRIHELEVPCFIDEGERRMYRTSSCKPSDMAREIARVFDAPLGAEFALTFVLTEPSASLSSQLGKSSVELVKLPASSDDDIEGNAQTMEEKLEEAVAAAVGSISPEQTDIPQAGQLASSPEPDATRDSVHEPPAVQIDLDATKIAREVNDMKELLEGNRTSPVDPVSVWREPKYLERVTSQSRVIVSPFVGASAQKDWILKDVEGERVFVETQIDAPKLAISNPSIHAFRELISSIVDAMGGNPATVNICAANSETDGDRREGQLFFNVLRNDKTLRWIVVAARELAYTQYQKPGQAHMSLMTDLIVKALERLGGSVLNNRLQT